MYRELQNNSGLGCHMYTAETRMMTRGRLHFQCHRVTSFNRQQIDPDKVIGEDLSEILFLCLPLLSALTPCLNQSCSEQELLWHPPGELYPVTTVITGDGAVYFFPCTDAEQNKDTRAVQGKAFCTLPHSAPSSSPGCSGALRSHWAHEL